MQIRDILERGGGDPVLTIADTMSMLEAACRLQACDNGALAVMRGDDLVGILTERALVDAVASRGPGIAAMKVADAMAPARVTCTLDGDVGDTLTRMRAAGVHHVPVLRGRVPVAMLTSREFESACLVLTTQAGTDELTGLANRRSLLPEIVRELDRHHRMRWPLAVAMLDLDRLKRVNDRLGHAAGDAVLRLVGRTLERETRACDKVARIGGDEFALLFTRARLRDAVVACRRVLLACSRIPLPRIDGMDQVTISIGVTVAADDDTAETILERADRGLYQAKASGGGQVVAIASPDPDAAPPAAGRGTRLPAAADASAPAPQSAAFSASS